MATQGEKVAALEQRLRDHEGRCEERLAEIKAVATDTKAAVEGLKARSWGIVIAILAWALSQMWIAQQARIEHIEQKPAAVR
jgi:hypothetical protein